MQNNAKAEDNPHYDQFKCRRCGQRWWALQPQHPGPIEGHYWPGEASEDLVARAIALFGGKVVVAVAPDAEIPSRFQSTESGLATESKQSIQLEAEDKCSIENWVNCVQESEALEEYFISLRVQQDARNYFEDLENKLLYDVLDEETAISEFEATAYEIKALDYQVECFQKRFPQLKGPSCLLSFHPQRGLCECLVSDDPKVTGIWGDFPSPELDKCRDVWGG